MACRSRGLILGLLLALAGCVARLAPPGPPVRAPAMESGAFVMRDGARLPYRAWLPEGPPKAVVLALHGFNDSRDAWAIPAPSFTAAGIALYAPDQRGFGAAPGRGLWPGTKALAGDARRMARLLHRRYPHAKLFLMGESMGAAVLMVLATAPAPPPVAGYILSAPAVWGRKEMSVFMTAGLWVAARLVPGLALSGAQVAVRASDNNAALRQLFEDPLTIRRTRFDTLRGLVDLMDHALAAASHFQARALFLYGRHDHLVPKHAMADVWRAVLAHGNGRQRLAFYPKGYHLLLRDLVRAAPIGDIIAWIDHPLAPLPSGAGLRARSWLARRR